MLGEPGVGIHTHVGGVAIIDVLLTIILSAIASSYLKVPLIIMFAAMLLLSIFLHWLFCVPTTLSKALGIVSTPN